MPPYDFCLVEVEFLCYALRSCLIAWSSEWTVMPLLSSSLLAMVSLMVDMLTK